VCFLYRLFRLRSKIYAFEKKILSFRVRRRLGGISHSFCPFGLCSRRWRRSGRSRIQRGFFRIRRNGIGEWNLTFRSDKRLRVNRHFLRHGNGTRDESGHDNHQPSGSYRRPERRNYGFDHWLYGFDWNERRRFDGWQSKSNPMRLPSSEKWRAAGGTMRDREGYLYS
jgi:hypothetical protein